MTQEFDSALPPQPPQVSQLGEIYTLVWNDRNIQMQCERFDTDRHQNVTAEITVEILGSREGQGHIARGRAGLLSTYRTLIADCVDFGGDITSPDDWRIMFKQLSNSILDRYRMGEPVINLAKMTPVGKKPFILAPFIYEGNPTVIYGRGGVGKSIFCLYLAVLLQAGKSQGRLKARTMNILYLDYEADPDESKYRSDMLAYGIGLNPTDVNIHYRHCSVPLREEIDVIQRRVIELDIECVVIDSAVPACGDAIDHGVVSKFFNALRSLSTSKRQVASLIIGHTTKAQDTTGGPFGAVHWRNGPRSVWEFRADQQQNLNYIDVQLVHQKVNLDPLFAPLGFTIEWKPGEIVITDMDTRRHKTFGADAPLGDRIEVALEDNATMEVKALGTLLDAEIADIESVLLTDTRFVENSGKWELGAI